MIFATLLLAASVGSAAETGCFPSTFKAELIDRSAKDQAARRAFIDGGMTLTRPVYRRFSAGFGFWGAAQPGVYRVDAGPRVTLNMRNNLRVHFDWRQRLAGDAAPGSGPATEV